MNEKTAAIQEITKLDVLKIAFSFPYSKSQDYKKCNVRKVNSSKGEIYQFESFTEKQAFHENVTPFELCEKTIYVLENTFRQAEIFTPEYIYSLKITSKGKLLQSRRKNTEAIDVQSHNREKKYIIDLDNAPPVFSDLGIIGKDGKIINSKYDKYKQICRFIEFINDVVANDSRQSYDIVDFGCGKSYLTFVVYHYMTKLMGKKVNISGFDLKEDVINNCNELALKYGYENLKFYCMDIKDYKPKTRPDMVITLHACDVATDFALYNAYNWQADFIFSVPCCQHEMNSQIKTNKLSLLSDYGLLKERFCALATDALRAKLLEYCGYEVDVMEFIDVEHSPKNVLLRAKRTTRVNASKRELLRREIDNFNSEFSSCITFEKKLSDNEKTVTLNDEEFTVICGRASMLIKDAMKIRHDVFCAEQNYTKGASRDDDDETAFFVNVYKDNRVIATSRMIYTEKPDERLCGKIAVAESYRKFGLGKIMLLQMEKKALDEKVHILRVNAQERALGFYERLGYSQDGEPYTEEDIKMIPVSKICK